MIGKVVFLGTGASTGIPVVGCGCSVCKSKKKKNKRLRPSCLIELKGKKFLIDATCDFRQQALRENILQVDGVLLTHLHFDHSGGLDDLRIFSILEKKAIKCLLSQETLEALKIRYPYFFSKKNKGAISVKFDFQIVKGDFSKNFFEGILVENLSFFQNTLKVTGYRIGSFAYISDIKTYDEKIFSCLKGIDVLVLSALRKEESSFHFNIKQAIEFAEKTTAKKVYFTHIAHEIDHHIVQKELPKGFYLAYDGLLIDFVY